MSVSALLELPPELLVAVARETDEFTRFVLGFVCRSLLALAPLLCALDPPSTSYRFAGLALAAVRARSPGLLEWATRGRWSAPVTTAVLDEALALGQFTLVERLLELGAAIGEYTIVAAARGSDAALVARIDAFSVAAGLMPSATVLRSLGEAVMRRRSQALLEWLLTSRYFKASATVLDLSYQAAFAGGSRTSIESVAELSLFSPWRAAVGAAAALDLELFEWIVERFGLSLTTFGPDVDTLARAVCTAGSAELLAKLFASCPHLQARAPSLLSIAVTVGQVPVVRYLIDNIALALNAMVSTATYSARFDVLRLLVERGASVSDMHLEYSASRAPLGFLEFLEAHGCYWTSAATLSLLQNSSVVQSDVLTIFRRYLSLHPGLSLDISAAMRKAAMYGKTAVLDLLASVPGAVVIPHALLLAALQGASTAGVLWAIANGAVPDQSNIMTAVRMPSEVALLRSLVEAGCRVTDDVLSMAAESMASLDAMEYLHTCKPFTREHAIAASRSPKKSFEDVYWLVHHSVLNSGELEERRLLKQLAFANFQSRQSKLITHY